MMEDVKERESHNVPGARVEMADARSLPLSDESIDAVITSPPYVNRHDYTRVFGVELMFAFLDYEETKRLRYQSF
jgi:tRNA G10  N-methylase Trm11